MNQLWDVVIVGAGAAGLMTAVTAKRAGVPAVLLLDSKEKIGAKILMSGGTRCNLTNQEVTEKDFETEQKNILKSVLKFFPSEKAIEFFRELGITVVKEEGGKYFPSTHSGRTVLEAFLEEIQKLQIPLQTRSKVTGLLFDGEHFQISGTNFSCAAKNVVLTTGGLSYPSSGSEGAGYPIAQSFGHRVVKTCPALTPLVAEDKIFQNLSGLSLPARLMLLTHEHKKTMYEGSFLFTHFGYSGPVVLNISRYWIRERERGAMPKLEACFLPFLSEEDFTKMILKKIQRYPGHSVKGFLSEFLPQRFVKAVLQKTGISDDTVFNQLKKAQRELLKLILYTHPLRIEHAVGYPKAEVTAGGVDLAEVRRQTLESKLQPGLFFAGEILDVDGRIGGFNFQWAWASGVVAGLGAAAKAGTYVST